MRRKPGRRPAVAWRPALEHLEPRRLLSNSALAAPRGLLGHRRPGLGVAAAAGDGTVPTGAGIRSFFAAFTGTFTIGRGRIPGQALRTYLNGAGTSNMFLHGQVQVGIASPTDPSQGLAGTASLFDKNYAQTGNVLVLDLRGDPRPASDGRPSQLSWTVSDDSSGSFTGAEGSGTLAISYHPGGRRQPMSIASGRMGIQFRGQIIVSGTSNPLRLI